MIEILKNWPAGAPVPAISLRQPWAVAVIFFGKDIENRSNWPYKHRGPLIIHASKSKPNLQDVEGMVKCAREDGVEDQDMEVFIAGSYPEWLPLGEIVAVANLADVFGPDNNPAEEHPAAGSPWATNAANYWLYLTDVAPVKPVPFKGFVGMFKVPYDVAASLESLQDVAEYWTK